MSGVLFTVDQALEAAGLLRPSPRRGAGNARLRSAQTEEIRARLDADDESLASIANRYGVTQQRVGQIRSELRDERELRAELEQAHADVSLAISEGRCDVRIGTALLVSMAVLPQDYLAWKREQR